jgi:hypothetical protein
VGSGRFLAALAVDAQPGAERGAFGRYRLATVSMCAGRSALDARALSMTLQAHLHDALGLALDAIHQIRHRKAPCLLPIRSDTNEAAAASTTAATQR